MQSILIEKLITKNWYVYCVQKLFEDDNIKMEVLGDWFVHDVSDDIHWWIEWLNDDNYDTTESNATWLDKDWMADGECMITFGSIVDMIQDKKLIYIPDQNRVVILTKHNIIELLNTWDELLKTRPEQIMITEENGVYKMFAVQ